jgi:hypothetical protein
MDDRERALVVLLSMHRCGSSVTTAILQRLGMSLGPFDLIDANASNPSGHFEAIPFHRLNRQIQGLVYGFMDDLPGSPQITARFCETRGEWDDGIHIPDELLEEGQALIRTLLASGPVSGFKDPRTVLTWPFWKRVLSNFPDVRVIPFGLLRSPHEIAMSLVTRRAGWRGYWEALDVIAIHLRRQKLVLESAQAPAPCLCFGSLDYLKSLELAVEQCGLTWNAAAALEIFDRSAVHEQPSAITHEAQDLFDAMCGESSARCDSEVNRARQERDARFLENLRLDQWRSHEERESQSRDKLQRVSEHAAHVDHELRDAQNRLTETQSQLAESQRQLAESQRQLAESLHARLEVQAQLIDAENRHIQAQEREIAAWQRSNDLRDRLDRFESHPVLGAALRGRRRLRRLIHSVATGHSANGL